MNPVETNAAAGGGQDPEFMKEFQEKIQSYADLTEAGNDTEAQKVALSLLMMAAEEAIENPTPDLVLKQKADDLENRCEWGEAEKVRREILAMEEKIGKFPLIAKAQMDLSRLLRTLGRIEEAREIAREGIISARRAELFPVLVMALESAAFCAMEAGDPKEALALACERSISLSLEKCMKRQRPRRSRPGPGSDWLLAILRARPTIWRAGAT